MKTISFLASHGGSAAKVVISTIVANELNASIGIVITNNKDSEIYNWCIENGVTVFHVSGKTHPDEIEKDRHILRLLVQHNTELVVLSGYMKRIGPLTLSALDGKIMNIHPSLLPAHGGKGMYGDKVHQSVLQSREELSGATVHLVTSEYDEGPIVAQQSIPVSKDDTVDSLKKKIQGIEGKLYVEAIRKGA